MSPVQKWSGYESRALREALRMGVREFAERLGVSDRAVSKWEAGGRDAHPRPQWQAALDTALERSSVEVKARFELLLKARPAPGAVGGLVHSDDTWDHGSTEVLAEVPTGDHEPTPIPSLEPAVKASQDDWCAVRAALNGRRLHLARAVATLYEGHHQPPGSGLLLHPDWQPDNPVLITDIELWRQSVGPPDFVGTADVTAAVRPLATPSLRYSRYSRAVRALDHPRLFENRPAWRFLEATWNDRRGSRMVFHDTRYFDLIDVWEALAHEAASALIGTDGRVRPATWDRLPIRRLLGDPFDSARRAIGVSTDTLTIRRDRDGTSFVLHRRDPGNVAVAGGLLHVMPCGIFQPSSLHGGDLDFSLWHNIMREYSEEFLGNAEHDGTGDPVDYDEPPFTQMQDALDKGRARVFCLGIGLDALSLAGEILTVAVFDGDVYDDLFADMVDANDEGSVVKTGRADPTAQIPFSEHTVRELLAGSRLAPAAAGCLTLAWQHRRTIFGD